MPAGLANAKRVKILGEEESKCVQLYKLPIGQTQGCSGVNFPVFCSLVSPLPICSKGDQDWFSLRIHTYLSIYLYVYM